MDTQPVQCGQWNVLYRSGHYLDQYHQGSAIPLGMHNDVSFLIADQMNLYEQQSTVNPNLPLRMFQYAGNLYEKYIVGNELNKYGRELLKLPVPKLVVFYNGIEEKEDELTLRLSDSFPDGSDPDIDVKVRMVNVNYGHSRGLLDSCKPLNEYSWLIQEIRRKQKEGIEFKDAVNQAITDMPGDFEIRPFLVAHRTEVLGMLLTEYNEVESMRLFEKDGYRKGKAEGEGLMAKLMTILFGNGQIEEARKAALDESLRQELYKKYNLE